MDICGKRFRGDCGGMEGLYFGQADGFYIPGSMIDQWMRWSDAMLRRGSFLEMAVPTIINALVPHMPCVPPPNHESEEGSMTPLALPLCTSWGGDRYSYHETMIRGSSRNSRLCVAYHPIKLLTKPEVMRRIKALLQSRAASDCYEGAQCKGAFTPDADGFLWRRKNA